jgi:protocatechuate 3,4-dioxygenase beta subunit
VLRSQRKRYDRRREKRIPPAGIQILVAIAGLACTAGASPKEKSVGGTCNDCDAVFDGRPARLSSTARIAPPGEPGEALAIDGVVRDAAGKPVAGVIVYAYHTDAKGIYPADPAHRHGKLRGFAQTDRDGKYRFDTIRPASYPNSRAPQHVHMHVVEPGRCTYVIDELWFGDDPLAKAARRPSSPAGGDGMTTPVKDKAGAWSVRRDIVLGANVPGYAGCG